jgi:hypothetical protein
MADFAPDHFLELTDQNISELASDFAILDCEEYKNTGDIKAINDAIENAELAVQMTPEGHSNLASRLNNLGVMLGSRYERTGKMQDLEETIRVV